MTAGCDKSQTATIKATSPTVASLVPAATDLIIGMGASDHLVAISNWDTVPQRLKDIPRVGDYRNVDWEKIATLHPNIMIVQFSADKMPAGFAQRAQELNIQLLNVRNNRLDDLFATLGQLGKALKEEKKAAEAEKHIRGQLDGVRRRVAGKKPVRTLLARDGVMLEVVGGGNYLDQILRVAGGVNVIPGGDNSYPSIDREMLLSLNPQVIIRLLPDASKQVLEQAKEDLTNAPQVQALKGGRVYTLTQWYILQPGYQVGDMAELLEKVLHENSKSEIRMTNQIRNPK